MAVLTVITQCALRTSGEWIRVIGPNIFRGHGQRSTTCSLSTWDDLLPLRLSPSSPSGIVRGCAGGAGGSCGAFSCPCETGTETQIGALDSTGKVPSPSNASDTTIPKSFSSLNGLPGLPSEPHSEEGGRMGRGGSAMLACSMFMANDERGKSLVLRAGGNWDSISPRSSALRSIALLSARRAKSLSMPWLTRLVGIWASCGVGMEANGSKFEPTDDLRLKEIIESGKASFGARARE